MGKINMYSILIILLMQQINLINIVRHHLGFLTINNSKDMINYMLRNNLNDAINITRGVSIPAIVRLQLFIIISFIICIIQTATNLILSIHTTTDKDKLYQLPS